MMMMMISCGCKSSWIWLLMETDDQDAGCCQQPFLLYGRPFAMREDVSKILRIHKTSLLVIWFDMICLNILVWYDLLEYFGLIWFASSQSLIKGSTSIRVHSPKCCGRSCLEIEKQKTTKSLIFWDKEPLCAVPAAMLPKVWVFFKLLNKHSPCLVTGKPAYSRGSQVFTK